MKHFCGQALSSMLAINIMRLLIVDKQTILNTRDIKTCIGIRKHATL